MDPIVRGGNVITLCVPNKREQAIAIEDGRIAAIGRTQAIGQLATPDCRVIDFVGKTVLPGFIDSQVPCRCHPWRPTAVADRLRLAPGESGVTSGTWVPYWTIDIRGTLDSDGRYARTTVTGQWAP
jgi:predicted amidohydrolase